ncbi:putative NADH-ubiquinone oxidoreductase 14 kDa subunit [Pseudovirgaria hyperparasitica]|uniref:Putative NADH-ubiquinone oxidoreductase 14 kDa subunit n=1 Tax=Pseudovirgaria hyperparasitica TaxID=470096 RepID=A0A6A6WKC3_9PEZI|nr:putative NADH-ubiquinone oxidoreductase 14 kDa subunit [Pseudovirgaria hyperparasitica]KAF2762630.1 putative NADH-ubiquinone oxidoreductase 14 kDa subunit [Pseudovirgaria hyperparasitica]
MVSKILFWSGFGVAVRMWQLGIQMVPIVPRTAGQWGMYPVFAGIGGAFGYWLTGVEGHQKKFLLDRRDALLEKRRRVAEREAQAKDGASS